MKKFGFTLAEILITLGVIGVASALTAPTISNFVPDRNKVTVLNIYQGLTSLNNMLLGNEAIYYQKPIYNKNKKKFEYDCYGLGCTYPPLDTEHNDYQGLGKYTGLMIKYLSKAETTNPNRASVLFKCHNKAMCKIETSYSTADDNKRVLNARVTIMLIDQKNKCHYSSTCSNPDQFRFYIDTFGSVKPADPLSEAYLRNQLNMSRKKEDFALAKKFKNENKTYTWDL